MMVIPIEDHMVHRGHGVFDTAIILDGIEVQERHSTILDECRSWGLLTLPAGCPTSAFYAVVIDEDFAQCKEGVKVITSAIPMKSPLFATMKNVNYLPNVLSKMEAEDKGGPNVNVAFINSGKELILPSFDKILRGCTTLRLLQLAPKLVEQGRLRFVKTTDITVEDAKGAAEMMYVGSTLPLLPIIMWGDKPIGNGEVGELTMALSDLLWEDMAAGLESQRIPIPYA
ncbi:unnamed protein product [Withania somnifera]